MVKMKVTAVVPVYNEGKTVGNVLKVLTSSNRIDDVIVVDGGSTDNTPNIIKKFKVKIIILKKNSGKGNDVKKAAEYIKSDIVFMCDGDLHGFKAEHINQILEPLEKGYASMCIGLKENAVIGGHILDRIHLTGGERAIFTNIFKEIMKNPLVEGWGIESVMNHYCRKNNHKIVTVNLRGVTHTLRVKKVSWSSYIKQTLDTIIVRVKLFFGGYD